VIGSLYFLLRPIVRLSSLEPERYYTAVVDLLCAQTEVEFFRTCIAFVTYYLMTVDIPPSRLCWVHKEQGLSNQPVNLVA
jgi:hypothetical protein